MASKAQDTGSGRRGALFDSVRWVGSFISCWSLPSSWCWSKLF